MGVSYGVVVMVTKTATDVELQELDFSQVLSANVNSPVLFPIISDDGEIGPTLCSPRDIGKYGKSSLTNMMEALYTAFPERVGQESAYILRVTGQDARYPAALIGIFGSNDGENQDNFLSIAPLRPLNRPNASPVFNNGGIPLKTSTFNVNNLIDELGDDALRTVHDDQNGGETSSSLNIPLGLVWWKSPTSSVNHTFRIVSDNIQQLPTPDASKQMGGNLAAGTYTYTRVGVNSRGEIDGSSSAPVSVVLSPADISEGRRSIKLNWGYDDSSVKGINVYRVYTPTTGTTTLRNGRIAELQRTTVHALDDTFAITSEAIEPSTRQGFDDEFFLEILDANDQPVEVIAFTFDTIQKPGKPLIWEDAILTSNYITGIPLYDEDFVQDEENFPVIYTTPQAEFAGGFGGSYPTEEDLEIALKVLHNRDQIQIRALVDLGWCSPYSSYLFSQVEVVQRCHSLLGVPSTMQTAQAAAAYGASLPNASRRSSVYTPWMYRRNPVNRVKSYVPASAFACQAMMYSDQVASVGRSFAGKNRGVVDAIGVKDKERHLYSDSERDLLSEARVNYFRLRPDTGLTLWEDWTLQKELSGHSQANVSRLFDVIQNTISDFLEYSLKEPNDDYLVKSIVSGASAYLESHRIARNIADYEVVADSRSGNDNQTANEAIRNVDVYIEPRLAVRRFRLRTILTAQGASFEAIMQTI